MYIPILRYRQSEIAAIKTMSSTNVFTTGKIMPLIEIVQLYPSGRIPKTSKTFYEVYPKELSNYKFPIIIDIPMYIDLNTPKIENKYKEFLEPINNCINTRISYLKSLSCIKNLIPTITYNPREKYISGTLTFQEKELRSTFNGNSVCFRLYNDVSDSVINELSNLIKKEDILLLDLDEKKHITADLFNIYMKINAIKNASKCKTVLVRSVITNSFKNSTIKNCSVINDFDNSFLNDYKKLGFDAFGDFSGIKKDSLTESFRGYITNIFYTNTLNRYIGFTAHPSMHPKTYSTVIAPSIISSNFWSNIDSHHKQICPGCIGIINKKDNVLHPGNRTTWKSLTIEHYIYSIYDML
jgi:hypothetical protein